MRRNFASLALLCLLGLRCPQPASAVSIDTVPIGNPGNANDPFFGNLYGGVAYNYRIGTYDVTIGQYTAFLNAVAATDTYSLYNPFMALDPNGAGISQSGSSGSYTYSVIGSANHPITYVSWGDAARFSNWLQNGQPTGLQNASTTEDGAYFLNGATTATALNNVTRKAGATWFIPSESEWYKAAYYNPKTSSYYQYPTSSNTAPTTAPPGSIPNTANFFDGTTGYAVTGSPIFDPNQNYLTDVGAYTASASPYGTFDQGGDVDQWNEALIALIIGTGRGVRGGSWGFYSVALQSSIREGDISTSGSDGIGFRVATVPEPSAAVLAIVANGLIWTLRKRFK